MSYPILYDKTRRGQIQTWQPFLEGNTYFFKFGLLEGLKTETEKTICLGKNLGKKNETSPEEQAKKELEAIIVKKKEKGYSESLENAGATLYFEPMLAHRWDQHGDKAFFPMWVDEKLNGIRCVITKDGAFSRKGKRFLSIPHILRGLEPVFQKYPDIILDGELFNQNLPLCEITGLCSVRYKEADLTEDLLKRSEDQIDYYIYDLPSSKKFAERDKELTELISWIHDYSYGRIFFQKVDRELVFDNVRLNEIVEHYRKNRKEGVVIRYGECQYINSRSYQCLKQKNFFEREYTVLDVEEGTADWYGMAKKIKVMDDEGRIFYLNMTGSKEFCKQLLEDKESVKGKKVTGKFQELSPYGVPTIAHLVAIRDYE